MRKRKIFQMAGMVVLLLMASSCMNKKKSSTPEKPNVIMFIMDDLGDWISPLGYIQAKTPNLDRLAESGVNFTNAHAPGVFCAPSRTAIFTGLNASTTGCYTNEVFHYDHPNLETIQMAFNEAGYNAYGAGKIYHHRSGYADMRGWKEYFSRSQEVRDMAYEMNSYHQSDVPLPDPHPYSPYAKNHSKPGSSQLHLEWGPIPDEKEEEMADVIRTNWICDVLKQEHDKPFFMALGMYLPHYPNYAPKKYFDLYNRDELELPEYKADDLDDLSPAIQKFYKNRSRQHKELEELGAVKDAVIGQLACISFADAMLGRVLDVLENSPHKDNTIIVFWSDQGFHHGEKGHWGKHSLWQRTTQVPFIWAGKGIVENQKVETTVSLIDIYPTLIDLCSLEVSTKCEGTSLVPVLYDPKKAQKRTVFIPHAKRGEYAVVNEDWRYIYYSDGNEELYNTKDDPNEWFNLIHDKKHAAMIRDLKKSVPAIFAPAATPKNDLELIVEGDSFRWEKKNK